MRIDWPEDHAENDLRPRTDGHADGDLPRAHRHDIGGHAVETGGRQQQTDDADEPRGARQPELRGIRALVEILERTELEDRHARRDAGDQLAERLCRRGGMRRSCERRPSVRARLRAATAGRRARPAAPPLRAAVRARPRRRRRRARQRHVKGSAGSADVQQRADRRPGQIPGRRLVDDGDLWPRLSIRFCEAATRDDPQAHGAEQIGSCIAARHGWPSSSRSVSRQTVTGIRLAGVAERPHRRTPRRRPPPRHPAAAARRRRALDRRRPH